MAIVTLDLLHDWVGSPVVVFQGVDPRDGSPFQFTLEQLPPAALQAVLTFIGNHFNPRSGQAAGSRSAERFFDEGMPS